MSKGYNLETVSVNDKRHTNISVNLSIKLLAKFAAKRLQFPVNCKALQISCQMLILSKKI